MAVTRDFKQSLVERINRDPAFANSLLGEAVSLLLQGETETATALLQALREIEPEL